MKSIPNLPWERILEKSSLNSQKLLQVDGISISGPYVCKMGRLWNSLTGTVNDKFIFVNITRSDSETILRVFSTAIDLTLLYIALNSLNYLFHFHLMALPQSNLWFALVELIIFHETLLYSEVIEWLIIFHRTLLYSKLIEYLLVV